MIEFSNLTHWVHVLWVLTRDKISTSANGREVLATRGSVTNVSALTFKPEPMRRVIYCSTQ